MKASGTTPCSSLCLARSRSETSSAVFLARSSSRFLSRRVDAPLAFLSFIALRILFIRVASGAGGGGPGEAAPSAASILSESTLASSMPMFLLLFARGAANGGSGAASGALSLLITSSPCAAGAAPFAGGVSCTIPVMLGSSSSTSSSPSASGAAGSRARPRGASGEKGALAPPLPPSGASRPGVAPGLRCAAPSIPSERQPFGRRTDPPSLPRSRGASSSQGSLALLVRVDRSRRRSLGRRGRWGFPWASGRATHDHDHDHSTSPTRTFELLPLFL